MTVGELIDKLSKFNSEYVIKFKYDECKYPLKNQDFDGVGGKFEIGHKQIKTIIYDIKSDVTVSKTSDDHNIYLNGTPELKKVIYNTYK